MIQSCEKTLLDKYWRYNVESFFEIQGKDESRSTDSSFRIPKFRGTPRTDPISDDTSPANDASLFWSTPHCDDMEKRSRSMNEHFVGGCSIEEHKARIKSKLKHKNKCFQRRVNLGGLVDIVPKEALRLAVWNFSSSLEESQKPPTMH